MNKSSIWCMFWVLNSWFLECRWQFSLVISLGALPRIYSSFFFLEVCSSFFLHFYRIFSANTFKGFSRFTPRVLSRGFFFQRFFWNLVFRGISETCSWDFYQKTCLHLGFLQDFLRALCRTTLRDVLQRLSQYAPKVSPGFRYFSGNFYHGIV